MIDGKQMQNMKHRLTTSRTSSSRDRRHTGVDTVSMNSIHERIGMVVSCVTFRNQPHGQLSCRVVKVISCPRHHRHRRRFVIWRHKCHFCPTVHGPPPSLMLFRRNVYRQSKRMPMAKSTFGLSVLLPRVRAGWSRVVLISVESQPRRRDSSTDDCYDGRGHRGRCRCCPGYYHRWSSRRCRSSPSGTSSGDRCR